MATELVDASKLDACCTAEANAIRAKTGNSAQIAYDWANSKGFADAIAAIPTGGADNLPTVISGGNLGNYTENTITNLRQYAFYYYSGITKFTGNSIVNIGGAAFRNCTNLEEIHLPAYSSSTQGDIFNGCNKLTLVAFPSLTTFGIGSANFANCTLLATADLNLLTSIPANTFMNCSALATIILRKSDSLVSLANTNAFNGYLGDGGSLDYKAASNWSTVVGYGTITWAQIEGSQYENYYADGTTIT